MVAHPSWFDPKNPNAEPGVAQDRIAEIEDALRRIRSYAVGYPHPALMRIESTASCALRGASNQEQARQESDPAKNPKTGPAEGGDAEARRCGVTGWSQVAEAPEAETDSGVDRPETDSSRQGQQTSDQGPE